MSEPNYITYSARGEIDCRTHWGCIDLGCIDVGIGVQHHPDCGTEGSYDEWLAPQPNGQVSS